MSEGKLQYLKNGTKLNNRYTIKSVLGEGKFEIIYLGKDELLESDVTIKEYFPYAIASRNENLEIEITAAGAGDYERYNKEKEHFLHKAGMLEKLNNNPGIENVVDFFQENNTAYMVMEYLEGITLKDYVEQNGTLTADEVSETMSPVLKALDEVHEKGWILREITPDDIMLLIGGGAKLINFSEAAVCTECEKIKQELGLAVVFPPGYTPLERYQDHVAEGPYTDIYALCAVIYKCLTGITPQSAPDRIFDDQLKKPSELDIVIPEYMEQALMKGLNIKAQDRYQNIGEFCTDFYGKKETGPAIMQAGMNSAEREITAAKAEEQGQAYTPDYAELKKYLNPISEAKLIFHGVLLLAVIFICANGDMVGAAAFFVTIIVAINLPVLSRLSKLNDKMDKLKKEGKDAEVLEDFTKAAVVLNGNLRLGNKYVFGHHAADIYKYDEIKQIYQYVHKTNFVEDNRELRFIHEDGKQYSLCKLSTGGLADEELKKVLFVICMMNPSVKIGYK